MGTPAKKIAFHTLGCKLNFSETSSLSRDSLKYGYENVNSKEYADIYVFNTCSVTENANKETKKLIRRSKRINPKAFIALIGCYAQLKPEELINIDDVNMVLGTAEKFELLNHLDKAKISNDIKVVLNNDINEISSFNPSYSGDDRTRAFLKVQDGCDYSCTFCTIPRARGKSRSASINQTVNLAKKISKSKTKEIVLTGVNIGDFGVYNNESFLELIKEIDSQVDIDRVRISSIEPNLLSNEIIEFCFNSEKFMPHFHIPLQSGSNKILKSMRRRYKVEEFKSRINTIKNLDSHACIGVDVIVGYPSETEEDFMETYEFLKNQDVSYLHVFTYSERENTKAIDLKPAVPFKERSNRSKLLRELSDQKKAQFYKKSIGASRPLLVENNKNGILFGYTDNYIKVKISSESSIENTIQMVKILDFRGEYMLGEIIASG
ncbi:tRNA (N(6)-L-threonylcarbamoyladenosine(37)-C(2))-methylthiotransferase MtaB [bacterium]|jgi:threonylcarbamoyladenosine tRNA methylthiotransferase MtaB|nr:tRNA (N(6)-L-threonylcarbamoyladenosine(37)-C(2))-methylthiotransferase MtaB [bacterium]MBT5734086.1 tRNA (N(6)-L-threonylcarbamoyladenosine(37)-C(2))-methylthiotransferase MtaB [bacterium]